MSYKIMIDKSTCIGCEACTTVCDNFKMDDEGKAIAVKPEVDEVGCNKEGADMCPVDAIKIKEE